MAIERYLTNDNGFRKYVEMLETTPPKKRQAFLDAAKSENQPFAEAVEKCIITFDRITKLPEMELTEVLGAVGLKPELTAIAILSVEEAGLREILTKAIPRKTSAQVQLCMKEFPNPKPEQIGPARLALIQAARELERNGVLKSFLMPRFGDGFFRAK